MRVSLDGCSVGQEFSALSLLGDDSRTDRPRVGLTKVGEDYALKVNLREALPPGQSVPERIGDVPVCVEVVGRIGKRR